MVRGGKGCRMVQGGKREGGWGVRVQDVKGGEERTDAGCVWMWRMEGGVKNVVEGLPFYFPPPRVTEAKQIVRGSKKGGGRLYGIWYFVKVMILGVLLGKKI